MLVEQLRDVSSAYDSVALRRIDPNALRQYSPSRLLSNQDTADLRHPLLPTPFDAWGNPIRYVHPTYQGGYGNFFDGDGIDLAQRGPNRSDLEDASRAISSSPVVPDNIFWLTGSGPPQRRGDRREPTPDGGTPTAACPGGGTRPYFYSAGPDGDPSTIGRQRVHGSSCR